MDSKHKNNSGANAPKKNRTGLRIFKSILAVVLAVILVAGICVTVWVESRLSLINRVDSATEPSLTPDEIASILLSGGDPDGGSMNTDDGVDADDNLISDDEDLVSHGDRVINILLIGQDSRGSHTAKLSDTMILCTINLETKTLTMTSFMRDMYVKVPSYNGINGFQNRINCTYALGGMGMLDYCLYVNFGVEVDHNIEVSFTSFPEIIDLVGGVDIALTKNEAWYLNRNTGWGLVEGINHLDGEKALAYSRIRKIDSDFKRTERQRNVLTAIVELCKKMTPAELDALLVEVLPLISTDMSNSDIYGYMAQILPILPSLTVQTLRIPADGAYYGANKGTEEEPKYVLIPDLEKNREILREVLGTE